jgi:hypothetical protein
MSDESKHETIIFQHNDLKFLLILIVIIIYTGFRINTDKNVYNRFNKLTHNKFFIVSSCIISVLCFCLLYFNRYDINDTEKQQKYKLHIQNTINQSLIAFIIAIFAYLEMIVSTFILVFLISYFLHMEV